MTFLITGATGFIGRKLIAYLLANGHAVNYLARQRSRLLDSRAAFHVWNPREPTQLNSVPRLDCVVHLAGEPIAQRWSEDVKRRIRDSRVLGTRNLVSAIAALKHKPSVLVSASAVGYYGDRGDEILTEESRPGTGFLADVCVAWEQEAAQAQTAGLRVARLRIATVLGKEGGALPRMLQPFKLGLGGKFGSGSQWMSWIHIQDLIRMIVFAAETPAISGAINASSPQPVRNAEFAESLAHTVNRPAFLHVPQFTLRLVLGEMAEFLFDSLRVVPEAAQGQGFAFDHPTLQGALSELVCRSTT